MKDIFNEFATIFVLSFILTTIIMTFVFLVKLQDTNKKNIARIERLESRVYNIEYQLSNTMTP